MNGPWDISQTDGALGYELCTGCGSKSKPGAERVVDSTLMDMLDQWASSMVPRLQLHHVARFCSRELVIFPSADASGVSLNWIWKFQPKVPAPQSEQHTPVSHRIFKNWELSLSIQRIHRGATWLNTFLHGTDRLLLAKC